MITPDHIDYVRKQLAEGATRGDVTTALLRHGWKQEDIDAAFAGVANAPGPVGTAATPPVAPAAGAPLAATPPVIKAPTAMFSAAPHHERLRIIAGTAVLLLLVGGGIYAYAQKIGPFANPPYSESNLMSGLFAASEKITSASYSVTASLDVGDREVGAEPFRINRNDDPAFAAQYARDVERAEDASDIVSELYELEAPYPATLSALADSSYYDINVQDPSGVPYAYARTATGFTLRITFETDSAIGSVRDSYFDSDETDEPVIEGRTVTFNERTHGFFYVPEEPPKPFLEELADSLSEMPSDISFLVGITAAGAWTTNESDWKFNVDVDGDFGDLSFKVNVDALRVGDLYYLRVNNIPSIVGEELAAIKGKWIKLDPDDAGEGELGSLAEGLPEIEKEYKESREKLAGAMMTLARIADESRVFTFKSSPRSERVDGKQLYRYDLGLRQAGIIAFFEGVAKASETDETLRALDLVADDAVIEYLKSEEFTETANYLNENITTTFWVDEAGQLAKAAVDMRIVPPDEAGQLKGKQINLMYQMTMADVNQPVMVTAPTDVMSPEELSELLGGFF